MKYSFIKVIFFIILCSSTLITVKINAQMFWNQEADFGNNKWISVQHSASLNITGDFTVEAWVYPKTLNDTNSVIVLEKMSADNTKGYSFYINQRRVAIRTNGTTRLIGTTLLSNDKYYHIAASLNGNTYRVYFNGYTDAPSAIIAGEAPLANTDSLFIGKGLNEQFVGYMDDIRIWNRGDVSINLSYRTTIGTNSGLYYKGLVLSLPFQGSSFIVGGTFSDYSGLNNHVRERGATLYNLTGTVYRTIFYNPSFYSQTGLSEYLAGVRNNSVNPTTAITLEAWIYPTSSSFKGYIIYTKDNDYSLFYDNDKKVKAVINNNELGDSREEIPVNQWNHVAFTYKKSNGAYNYYINGVSKRSETNDVGIINASGDSLYISYKTQSFRGYIDEVRISDYEKTDDEIKRFLYRSIDESNTPRPTNKNVVYNLDGLTLPNAAIGPELFFRRLGRFSDPVVSSSYVPVSPLNRTTGLSFTNGFTLQTSNKRIPADGTSGTITEIININKDITISDVNLFVALNHSDATQLKISLKDPTGVSTLVYDRNSLNGRTQQVITIFDDNGHLLMNNFWTSFAPNITPKNDLNVAYNNKKTKGDWTLTIEDVAEPDDGMLYAWGIQINNREVVWKNADIKVLVEGIYRHEFSDYIIQDTMRAYLRSSDAPYNVIDSSTVFLEENGLGEFSFESPNVEYGIEYYIEMKHRNSLETWSAFPVSLDDFEGLSYDFTQSDSSAYGKNQKLVDPAFNLYAIFSGDVIRDGVIDLFDIITVFNDAKVFTSGYVNSDVDGSEIVDLNDLLITYNNATGFVSVMRP